MGYDWNFSILLQPAVRHALVAGLLTTLVLTAACITIGTPLGIVGGMLALTGRPIGGEQRLRSPLARMLASGTRSVVIGIVDVIRAIPLLLFILLCYYALQPLLNIGAISGALSLVGIHSEIHVSPIAAVIVAMSVNLAAFVADLVRAAGSAVPRGSILAARSLAMSDGVMWRRIILPHVMREILPGLALLYISMLKLSTLASVVAVYELLHAANNINQTTYRTLELYVAVCVIFIAIVLPLSALARRMERAQAFRRRS